MLEYLLLLVAVCRAVVRDRDNLVAENLLLRQHLAILTRPARKPPPLRARDRLLWILVRSVRRDWRRHLVLVRAGDRGPLASRGVEALLALALARPARPGAAQRRGP